MHIGLSLLVLVATICDELHEDKNVPTIGK